MVISWRFINKSLMVSDERASIKHSNLNTYYIYIREFHNILPQYSCATGVRDQSYSFSPRNDLVLLDQECER